MQSARSRCEILLGLSVLVALFQRGHSQCTTAQFMDAEKIVSTCCESSPTGNCAEVFPTTCAHSCAKVLVPYMDECGDMVTAMPDGTFASFAVGLLANFADSCRQTMMLWARASNAGSCGQPDDAAGGGAVVISRIDSVNAVRAA